ncbi:Hsp70 family protein [Streptomyces lasiicapitis]|uniref:Molecular chaperone n=1 Tax=Streptomyces lasiicapitis TaxID=1923961 RepID=A0ABQ2LRN2_9ACTN|nr:hypothetical protein [Streptomyces lasiicapitis]GGO42233.1 hypothetical protein GCM10012286_23300 [Streptomyces lasiicapitis]
MGLTARFSSSGPSCVADAQGEGFTLLGPLSALRPPDLQLWPTPGGGTLVSRVEVLAAPGLAEEDRLALYGAWSSVEGHVVTAPVNVSGASVALSAAAGHADIPVVVRLTHHDMNPVTGRPVSTIHAVTDVAATLHLDMARQQPSPPSTAAPQTARAEAHRPSADAGSGAWYDPAQWTEPLPEPSARAAAAPAAAAPTGAATGGHGPRRVPGDAVRHFGFAAVDFGTTNSTVTIHDMRQLDVRAMSRHQETRLRQELVALLTDADAPGAERAQWQELLADVARQYLTDGAAGSAGPDGFQNGGAGRALADSLDGGYGDEGWVHALYTALELRVASRDERLRKAAAPLLHQCYHRAFDELPLDVLRLFTADLDHSGGSELPSRIEVVQTHPELRVRMGEERVAVGGGPGARSYRGLKQYLGRDHRMEGLEPATADDLIREGLRYLLDQTDEYIAANPKEFHQGKIDHVVMTYPTVAPPVVRRRLRELVGAGAEGAGDGLGVTLVDTQFDEAVAAALFFIMRDFAGDFVAGVEAFRARCRPLPGTDRAWQQNVLVVDVGGGTSDLALINLHLKDATPDPMAGQDPRFGGRLYVLTPTLLGSTGHLQLGGDLMTLRLFRWYKAAFADHLLTSHPDRYEHVVGSLDDPYAVDGRYVPRTLLDRGHHTKRYPADLVDRVVPTRWSAETVVSAAREDAEQTFWLLWELAEDAKKRLGAGDAVYQPLPETLHALLDRMGAPQGSEPEWAPLLDADTFAALLAPDMKEIMDLVLALTKNIVPGSELDRIFLTGKSSRMPLLRHSLERRLRQDGDVPWNPAGVAVEKEYGKLATSIGACWGHHIRRFAHTVRNARGVLGRGRYVLRIEVDNLSYYLPCDFGPTYQLATNDPTHALLRVGARLSPIGPGGTWAVRSKWQSLPASLRIHRNVGTGWKEWGAFDPDAYVRLEEPGFHLNMTEWTREATFELEVNADLDLSVHLARGAPHYEVGGVAPVRVAFDGGDGGQGGGNGGGGGGWAPIEIVADTRVAGDRPDVGVVVFSLPEDPRRPVGGPREGGSAWPESGVPLSGGPLSGGPESAEPPESGVAPRPGEPAAGQSVGVEAVPPAVEARRFDKVFRVGSAGAARAVRGMTSEPLGAPPPDGWSFYLRYPAEPDRKWDLLGVVPVPDANGTSVATAPGTAYAPEPGEAEEGAGYVATLDEHGHLRVHRDPVPYWTADSIAEMWHRPGSVFRVDMSDTKASYVAERDPFNGEH